MSAQKTRIYHRLQVAAHRLQKAADRSVMGAAGISTAQAAVLAIVKAQGPVAQNAVARQLGLNESGVTAMVTRLMGQGLLDRTRAADDARAWRLTVTDGGEAALKALEKPFRAVNQRLDDTLSAEEMARLADLLDRIAGAFDGE